MASVANFKQEYLPQSGEHLNASFRTRISVWIGLAAFVGWVLSRLPPRKRPTYVAKTIQEANHRSGEIKPTGKSKQLKDQGGLLSLVVELLGAVAINLVQRYSWKRSGGISVWCSQFADHTPLVDLLCRTDSSLRSRVYPGLREHLRHPR
jgi:hypothetical protein